VACRLVEALGGGPVRHVLCGLRAPRPGSPDLAAGLPRFCLDLGPRDCLGFLKLARLLRANRPAIVHARNWGTWTDAALACRLVPGVRLVLGFHGLQSATTFTPAQRRRFRWLGLHRAEFTTVSACGAEQLVAELGVDPARITVIPNGVDVKRYRPAGETRRAAAKSALGLPPQALIVGCVANFFEPVKGQDVLLEAFAELAASFPSLHLVLVGDGPRRAKLQATAAGRGLAGRVHFTGRREDVAEILAAFDVFACPSLAEGMSNAVLEALAAGLPGAVTDVSDHRAMFASIDPTLVVPPGDAEALADVLSRLLADESRRRRCAAAARRVACSMSFGETIAAYRRFYAGLLHQPASEPAQVHPTSGIPSCPVGTTVP
jgi:glycosyltransferase involved in cell wall biosynthesis